jgi:hypothetical protein
LGACLVPELSFQAEIVLNQTRLRNRFLKALMKIELAKQPRIPILLNITISARFSLDKFWRKPSAINAPSKKRAIIASRAASSVNR